MSGPRIAVLTAPGSNREGEAARAVTLAGGAATIVAIGDPIDRFDAAILPGGFSYGDALGAGMRWAFETGETMRAFAAAGKPVLGICNGFQALVRAGLLPGDGPAAGPEHERTVTLTTNIQGRFVCRWVALAVAPGNAAGLGRRLPAVIACPVAHGEGRLAVRDAATLDALAANGNVLFRYVEGTNPNGSVGDIAGLCDRQGLVWGLMPHPEDHIVDMQNPFPHRRGRCGLALFEAFVSRARAL